MIQVTYTHVYSILFQMSLSLEFFAWAKKYLNLTKVFGKSFRRKRKDYFSWISQLNMIRSNKLS